MQLRSEKKNEKKWPQTQYQVILKPKSIYGEPKHYIRKYENFGTPLTDIVSEQAFVSILMMIIVI